MVRPNGRYESAVFDKHTTVRGGTLAEAQIEELQGLVSETQFDIYLEESADCEVPHADVTLTTVFWREDEVGVVGGRHGCWVRSDVEQAETQEFLDTISNMQLALVAE